MGARLNAPLVVTLALPTDVAERFDAERRRFFPAGRTQVGAHLTLFHAVPGEDEARVFDDLTELAPQAPLPLRISGVMPLGRGVAYRLESAGLDRLHAELQRRWWDGLTRQDRQPLRAHVTVQNKVDPGVARDTVTALRADFVPATTTGTAWQLWRYDGGPWTHLADVPFIAS